MDAFEEYEGFEDVPESELNMGIEPEPEREPEPEPKREPEPEPKPEPKREPEPEPKRESKRESKREPKTTLGRSEKQARVDRARAEQLQKLRERYDIEFANIQKKRPRPKAYNAASILSAPDPEEKIKQILARDRAIYTAKHTRKNLKSPKASKNLNITLTKRNAPSILSSTRSAAKEIRDKAKADLKALKEDAEKELRRIGANVSVLHPIFYAESKNANRANRSRQNQIASYNN